MQKTVTGDLIELAKSRELDVIIHGCNCFHAMNSGIAKQIKAEFPLAFKADKTTTKGDRGKLGTYSVAEEHGVIVVNAYTQHTWWNRSERQVDYEALQKVFQRIAESGQFKGCKIGYPMIGAGLAGGDWEVINSIICEELRNHNHTLVELPKRKSPLSKYL
jgi:O-acetyl-ADP-ribose deacetylase (regulator of RNase III)